MGQISEEAVKKLTYEDIKPGVCQYLSKEVKRYRNPNGSWHRVYEGENYYNIKALGGMITCKEWAEIALRVVEAAGDLPLLDAITEHVEKLGWNFAPWGGVTRYALECLISKAWEAWEERGEFQFNRNGLCLPLSNNFSIPDNMPEMQINWDELSKRPQKRVRGLS